MSKNIRPLTVAERKSPATSMFLGGFKNVAFQIGKIEGLTPHSEGQSVPAVYSASLVKTEKLKYPVKVPTSVRLLKSISNVICNVVGQQNQYGDYDAFLIVRNVEKLSSFSIALRNIKDVIDSGSFQDDEAERIGKGQAARAHNQVMLTGLVVGTWFEDGQNPRFHIKLRQTSDPANIIPLVYEAKNASAQVGRVKIGNLISVNGEYAIQKRPAYETENGLIKRDENKRPIVAMDDAGQPLTRLNSYIRIQAPMDTDLKFDTTFVRNDESLEFPGWVLDWVEQAKARSQRTVPGEPQPSTETPVAAASNGSHSEHIGDL